MSLHDNDSDIGLLAWFIGCVIGLAVILACVVGVPTYYSDKYECGATAENAGVETKFVKNHLFSWDCYVRVNDGWIPINKWRGDEE